MSVESKYTLRAQNQSSFPNNETGYITPEILREFNIDMIDSLVDELGFASYSASVFNNTNSQINSLSQSVALTNATQSNQIIALQQFSSSLDATYATDTQLSASASTLQNQITSLSSSTATSINGLSQSIETLEIYTASVSTSVGLLQTFSSSQYKADSSSFNSRIEGIIIGTGFAFTGSSNTFRATQFISGNLELTGTITSSLQEGYVLVGGANGRTELAATSSIRGVQFPFTGSAVITGSLSVIGPISSSTITGIGNVTTFSTSVDSRLDIVEATASLFVPFSQSVDSRLDLVESTSSYLNTTFSTSVDSRLDLVEGTASVLTNTFSASQYKTDSSSFDSRLDLVESTASVLTNTFSSSQYKADSSSFDSRLDLVEGTASVLTNTFSSSQYKADSSSFDSRLDLEEFKSTTFATTGSNSFIGNQTITGSLLITGSVALTGSINVLSGSFSGSVVTNVSDTFTTTQQVNTIVTLTAAEYSGLVSSSANTLYIII